MDINHLIETREYILLTELLEANRYVKILEREKNHTFYDYCGYTENVMRPDKKIKTSFLLAEIENCRGILDHWMFILLSLDTSSICRKTLTQKSYDRIMDPSSYYCPLFGMIMLNVIVTEYDLGIITTRIKIKNCEIYEKEIKDYRKNKNIFDVSTITTN